MAVSRRWSASDGHASRSMPVTTVFLDRDGTLNVKAAEGSYVTTPQALRLLPGVARAVRRLNDARMRVVVVTNQRAVSRGLLDGRQLAAIHDRLCGELDSAGASLDRIYVCTHALGVCGCRKPLPGLLLRAAAENPGIDLSRAVMVGDAETDVAAGMAAGTATVRLAYPPVASAADVVVSDLPAAVAWILGHCDGAGATAPGR